MLAQILADTRHQVVITTNFDNLVADSVLLFTDTFAQSVGHESLTGFIRVEPRRPLVAKIHRDLLVGPQSDPDQTMLLHEDWARALRKLFTRYTPLFVGYGGNDGSLMNFLYRLRLGEIPGGIFWCYRESEKEKPSKRILNLVARHKGKLVSITDFDVFMTQLAEPLGYGLIDTKFQEKAAGRAKQLRKAWDEVKQGLGDKASLQKAAFAKVEKRRAIEKKDWWAWELVALAEQDPQKREDIYREGLEQFPDSPELTWTFAIFMAEIRKDYDQSAQLYRKAMGLDPDDLINLRADYLEFLIVAGRFEEAAEVSEGLWRRATTEHSDVSPTVALCRGLLLLFDGKDDVEALSRLKTLFQEGLHDVEWRFEEVLSAAESILDGDNKKLYSAISEAIRDPNKVAALDEFPRWNTATPIPLDKPWPLLTE